jgi:hypothetical protein
MNRRSALAKTLSFVFCVFLTSCDVPALFWEEETRKVVDDTVDEEEKLHPQKTSFQRI